MSIIFAVFVIAWAFLDTRFLPRHRWWRNPEDK